MLYLPAEFPQDAGLCYMNHAGVGPWPRRTAQVVANFAHQNMTSGATDYPSWLEVESRLRGRLAKMIGAASPDDIALVPNTSVGLSIISQGLDWREGDEVIGLAGDFASNTMVWEMLSARGVVYRPIDAMQEADPEGVLIAALSNRTRLLAISTVHFATGYRFDMARLSEACRSLGILLSVDAIQSLGAARFDLGAVPADFVVAGGHKWLLSPEGLGFLYCRPDLRERLTLHQFGWAMRAAPYDFEADAWMPASSARRFEAGTPNMIGIHAMDASLSLFEEVGMSVVEERLAANLAFLQAELQALPDVSMISPKDPARRAGILTIRHTRIAGKALHAALMRERVICAARAGGIRLAPHFYTPQAVLETAIDKIRQTIQII